MDIWKKCGNGTKWFGYRGRREINTILKGCGKGKLDFGNCGYYNKVNVYLNGQEVGSATGYKPNNIAEFNFNDGDLIEIVANADNAVIQFNSFSVSSCGCPGTFNFDVHIKKYVNFQIRNSFDMTSFVRG